MSLWTTATALVAQLKACTNLRMVKRVHEAAVQAGCDSDVYLATTFIRVYGKCGSVGDAREVFDRMNTRTIVSWNALISGYAENGLPELALDLFLRLQLEFCPPNERTFVAALKACTELDKEDRHLRGEALHLLSCQIGCDRDNFVRSSLVDMYAKCERLDAACRVFGSVQHPDVVSWNALILGYVDNGESVVALELFCRMRLEGCTPDYRTFVFTLKACTNLAEKDYAAQVEHTKWAKSLHLLALRCGFLNEYVTSALVDLYAKCMSMQSARGVFEALKQPNAVCWNALILGYADSGECEMVLDLLPKMVDEGCSPDAITFVTAVKVCTLMGEENCHLQRGRALHLLAALEGCDSRLFLQSSLLDMYAKCGDMEEACRVFNTMKERDLVSWTSLLLGYADNGDAHLCLVLLSVMRSDFAPDGITFVAALKGCAELALEDAPSERGTAVILLASLSGHDSDIHFRNTMIDLYARLGSMSSALEVFNSIEDLHVVSWNALILGYAENGDGETALDLFFVMRREGCPPATGTFLGALRACSELATRNNLVLDRGQALHLLASSTGCDSHARVRNTLVDMYAKCKSMKDSRSVFDMIRCPDVVSWTALILGYADCEDSDTVLVLFARMKRAGCLPDVRTYVGVLKSCALLGALAYGQAVYAEICSRGLDRDQVLASCVLDFHARSGNLQEAKKIFERHPTSETNAWNILMTGFGRQGNTAAVFDLFERMQACNVVPNGVTFLCVLTACSHAGLVDKGKDNFEDMSRRYGLFPNIGHYTCMLDLFGRANRLEDAMVLLRSMPFRGNDIVWMVVLGACEKWSHVHLGKLAFQTLTSLDYSDSAAYVLMTNIYRNG